MDIRQFAEEAEAASVLLGALSKEVRNNALMKIAGAIEDQKSDIIQANIRDISRSKQGNLPVPLLKRLKFDDLKIDEAVKGIRSLASLDDPLGRTLLSTELDEGLELYKVSCPIGVIGVIFESRPDALVQISVLCLKSGNSVLLKGGAEALETNRVLESVISRASSEAGVPDGWIHLLETRSDALEMLKMDDCIDLIIPRGSNTFVKFIMDNSRIPVMGHSEGICHCYVDEYTDIETAVKVVVDSKIQYIAVCNAAETLLVHEYTAGSFLPALKEEMDRHGVALYGCDRTCAIIPADPASENSWWTEYLDYKMSVKVVGSIDEAIGHINKYGSKHTDSIITNNKENAAHFMKYVDSANVFLNCSTRFSDGYRYGFGAEVGISTSKIHARGPVGLEGLTIYKYLLLGNGQIVEDYNSGRKVFTHRKLDKKFPL